MKTVRTFPSQRFPLVALIAAVSLFTLSGCGSSGDSGSGASGGTALSNTASSTTVIQTSKGPALQYSFTAAAVQPAGLNRFLAGTFPSNVPMIFNNSFMGYPVLGNTYGQVTSQASALGGNTYRRGETTYYPADLYTMATMNVSRNRVACNTQQFNPQTGFYNCDQWILSGVLSLGPGFVTDRMNNSTSIQSVAFDLDMTTLSGIVFIQIDQNRGTFMILNAQNI